MSSYFPNPRFMAMAWNDGHAPFAANRRARDAIREPWPRNPRLRRLVRGFAAAVRIKMRPEADVWLARPRSYERRTFRVCAQHRWAFGDQEEVRVRSIGDRRPVGAPTQSRRRGTNPPVQECCGFSGTSLSFSANRPSSGSVRTRIFRIALLRWTFTVLSVMPISPAICLLRRPRAT
jgi:hypothetical protein